MSQIEIKHVTKIFGQKNEEVTALNDINISIDKADIYGIIGMSGAGKSTLVRCLNYLEEPTDGEVIVDGKNLGTLSPKELRAVRSEIAMIFQHFNLLMQKTVLDNVLFPLKLQKVPKKEAKKKALELLSVVGLETKANAYPGQLSGGQKQRVAIARALASSPKILLCDEATSALDPQTTDSILKLLKEINEQFGITVVIITHQMNVVQEICNRVAIIENGNLVEDGRVVDVFANPQSSAAKKLIYGEENPKYPDEKQNGDMNIGKKIRIVFSTNSAFEPVIANMIMHFGTPINILQANTKAVSGIAIGEMILGLPEDEHIQVEMEKYLKDRGLSLQEVK